MYLVGGFFTILKILVNGKDYPIYYDIYILYIFSPLRCLGCIPLRVFLRLDIPLLRHCYAAEVPLIARATAAAVALYSQPLTESMRCTWENSGKIPGYAWRFENGEEIPWGL